ncbi:MAG: N-acetylmuramoyl-L-alanine amidase [Candidatus Taylorbacteria bacterium]
MPRKDFGEKFFIVTFIFVFFLGFFWTTYRYPNWISNTLSAIQYAGSQLTTAILSHKPKSIAEIQSRYDSIATSNKRVRILLIPGHEPNFGGAEYGNLKERDMTLALAHDLQEFLQKNSHYQIFITRDGNEWTPDFADYFKNSQDIIDWQKASHEEGARLVALGPSIEPISTIYHNTAPQDVALRLYGITKWANEHDIDIEIHIHFNDNEGHGAVTPGKYSGFVIYVPATQYYNSTSTKAIANTIFKRLAKYNPVSDLPGEALGIVDEPELIAIGSNNTADAASMLIEYGYMYEPQLVNPQTRSMAIRDLAFQTYLGLQDFFEPYGSEDMAGAYDTAVFPYEWGSLPTEKNISSQDVFTLQTVLIFAGVYPPQNKSKNDCPRSGIFGPCTLEALTAFQKKYGILGEQGTVGGKTLEAMNRLYK